MECLLWVGEEILHQMEYLAVMLTGEIKMEQEVDKQISAASAVMQTLHWSVMVKKELS